MVLINYYLLSIFNILVVFAVLKGNCLPHTMLPTPNIALDSVESRLFARTARLGIFIFYLT